MALLLQSGEVIRRFDGLVLPLATVEQNAIESAMILCEGNAERAARLLGVGKATLYRKLREYREKSDA